MNDQDTLLLSAYIDEQLDTEQVRILQQRLKNEPDLKQHLDQMRNTDVRLHDVFNPIVDEPLSEGLQRLLSEDDSTNESASVVEIRTVRKEAIPWVPMSVAASVFLTLGVVIGLSQTSIDVENTLFSQVLEPSTSLARILSNSPSGELNRVQEQADFSIQAELSFVDNRGVFCRQYHIQKNQQAVRGIACMEDQQWQNVVLVPATYQAVDTEIYQAASSFANPVINQYIEQNMQGISLGKDDEQRELDKLSDE